MALISQSTQPPWKFERLAALMVSRAHELKIVNTVCPVTIRRQEDTLEAAKDVDLMVVVGGRSSANTKELTRLCEIAGTTAIQIESMHDLTDASAFGDARVVGVTGGTSTPIEDLRDVAQRILELAGTPEAQDQAAELAAAALERAATPAGRTTSLPNITARPTVRRRLTVAAKPTRTRRRRGSAGRSRSSPSSAARTSARARSSTASSGRAPRSSRTAPARRATACTATPSGTDGASCSSTPAASSSTRTIRSRRASRSRPAWRSPRPTSSSSWSTRSRA